MQLLDHIYLVGSGKMGLSNFYDCHIYLIDSGSELCLIDAGTGLEVEPIIKNIRAHGFEPEAISKILVTHAHSDHAGGLAKLKAFLGAKIMTSEEEARLIESGTDDELGLIQARAEGSYPLDYQYEHCKVEEILGNDDVIPVGKFEIKAIKVSGHSKGSLCFFVDMGYRRVLFSGDVVFYGGLIGILNCYGSDLNDYRANIDKLANLGVDALLPGNYFFVLRHGQLWIDKAIENLKKLRMPPTW